MAKGKIADFDIVPANNTDIGGIDVRGTASVQNFDDAFRTLMAYLKVDAGAARAVLSGGTGATTAAGARDNLGAGPKPIAFMSIGGSETSGLDTVKVLRLDAGFVSVGPTALINFSCSIVLASGASFTAFLQGAIRDPAIGGATVVETSEQVVSSTGIAGMSRTLAVNGLVVGKFYTVALLLRASVTNSCIPQGMMISGWNA